MAINAYCGRPGSGKSYTVVANLVLPALQANRRIVTNIPLEIGALLEHFPCAEIEIFVTPEEFAGACDLANNPDNRGAIFIIDECWKYFPAGARTNDLPKSLQTFLAEHRHFVGLDGRTTEIALVTQSLYQLAPFARELIDTTYITSKLDKVGKRNSYRVDAYSGPMNLNRIDPDRMVNQTYGTYKAEIWRFYTSHTHNDTGLGAGVEELTDRRGSVWSSPMVRYGFPGAILVIGLAFWQLSGFLDPTRFRESSTESEGGTVTVPHESTVPRQYVAAAAETLHQVEPYSKRYRLVGIIYGKTIRDGQAVIRDFVTGLERVISTSGACVTLPKLPDQWQCRYFGDLVTFFSGEEPRHNTLL